MARRISEGRVPAPPFSGVRTSKRVSPLAYRTAKRVSPLAYRLRVTIELDWSLAMRRARPLESSFPSQRYRWNESDAQRPYLLMTSTGIPMW